MRLSPLLAVVLLACGAAAEPAGKPGGPIDRLELRPDAKTQFTTGAPYVFEDYWTAYDTLGRVVTGWRAKWNFGERDAPLPGAGDGESCTVVPLTPYAGYLYVFVPSVRAEWEQLGQQFLFVRGPEVPDSEVVLPC